MVIVEFFSETMIENMISALANAPERVVLVGDAKMMKITVIDGIQEMTEAKLIKRLKAES